VSEGSGSPRAFLLYRDSALRREALARPPGSPQRYSLYGLDELAADGLRVRHNLESATGAGLGTRFAAAAADRVVRLAGGYSGDFGNVLRPRRLLDSADVVFSTVDTVGIPLVLLSGVRLVRPPIVYAAIGLPERIVQLAPRANRAYVRAYRRLHALVAYGWREAEALQEWLGPDGPPVHFVPFGVDTDAFRPSPAAPADVDVVSVGGDPRRDYDLLLALAERRPDWSFRVVASRDQAPTLAGAPANVGVELDLPFDRAYERLARSRVVVLPVRDNSYSGATTVLLQSMALAKPVVVSHTAAIARGYHLEDGDNVRLVPPGDVVVFERAVADVLADAERATAMGARARETVERHLTWKRYTGAIRDLLLSACDRTTFSA
jgi:glycosyltransferase involved in cell wall biosynthesis